MRNVIRITTEGKIRPVRRRALESIPAADDQASLIALIQAVIPWGLQAVGDVLEAEVTRLAGERYGRTGGQPGLVRWGYQPGSVYLLDQKLPIVYPRVRDLARKREVPLTTYDLCHQATESGVGHRYYLWYAQPTKPACLGLSCLSMSGMHGSMELL